MQRLFTFLFIVFNFALQAQDNTKVTIHILDGVNKPIENVAIFNKDKTSFATTNFQGKAIIDVQNATDSLFFQHASYYEDKISFKDLAAQGFVISLFYRTIILDETVISVSKISENTTQVSNMVDVIEAKKIDFLQPQTSADMLASTGNVFVQKSQMGGGSPIIRGFEANKVLLVVDGVRLNNAIYRSGHLQNAITIDEAMLERTEVVFGPGSLIYGSDALGGVMHFYTKKPALSLTDSTKNIGGNISTRYGSASQEKTGHIDLNIGGQKLASLTSFSYSDYDDLRAGRNRNPLYGDWGLIPFYAHSNPGKDSTIINNKPHIQRHTGYSQYDVMQKFLIQPKDHFNILFNFQYSTSSDVPRYDKMKETSTQEVTDITGIEILADTTLTTDSTYTINLPKYATWHYGPQTRTLASIGFDYTSETKLFNHFNITFGHQYIVESRHDRRFGKSILESTTEKVNVYTLNTDFKKNLASKNHLLYGVEFTYNDVQSQGAAVDVLTDSTYAIQSRYPENGSQVLTAALYAKHTIRIAERATFSQGIRVSYISLNADFSERLFNGESFNNIKLNAAAVTGSFDFTFQPKGGWQVNTLFSSGYRAPNVDDVGKVFDPNPQEIVIPNGDLKPEYTYNFEAGLSKKIKDKAKLEGVFYYTILSNFINRQAYNFNGNDSVFVDNDTEMSQVLTNVNSDFAYITGISLSFKAELVKGLQLYSTFNYTYGRIKENDEPLAHIPPIYGRSELNFERKKFQTSLYVNYQGWKRRQNYSPSNSADNLDEATEFGAPSWWTLNTMMAYQFHEHGTVSFGIENLLDHFYKPYGSGVGGAGRNFVIGIRGNF